MDRDQRQFFSYRRTTQCRPKNYGHEGEEREREYDSFAESRQAQFCHFVGSARSDERTQGIVKINVLPCPETLSICIEPFIFCTT